MKYLLLICCSFLVACESPEEVIKASLTSQGCIPEYSESFINGSYVELGGGESCEGLVQFTEACTVEFTYEFDSSLDMIITVTDLVEEDRAPSDEARCHEAITASHPSMDESFTVGTSYKVDISYYEVAKELNFNFESNTVVYDVRIDLPFGKELIW